MDEQPGRIPTYWTAYLLHASRHDHVVVDRAAAWIHGVDAYAWAEFDLPLTPEACVIGVRRATRTVAADGCRRALKPEDWAQFDGVLVTTPLRTALDLGCRLRRWHAYAAMNALARAHDLTALDLVRGADRFSRRRGVVQVRELATYVDPRVESAYESRVLLAIIDAQLPVPTPQHWVRCDNGSDYRLDFAYIHRRIAVEYDGVDAHDDPAQRLRDRRRRDTLRREGWTVIVLTATDFHGPRAGEWLRTLRAELTLDRSNRRWP